MAVTSREAQMPAGLRMNALRLGTTRAIVLLLRPQKQKEQPLAALFYRWVLKPIDYSMIFDTTPAPTVRL